MSLQYPRPSLSRVPRTPVSLPPLRAPSTVFRGVTLASSAVRKVRSPRVRWSRERLLDPPKELPLVAFPASEGTLSTVALSLDQVIRFSRGTCCGVGDPRFNSPTQPFTLRIVATRFRRRLTFSLGAAEDSRERRALPLGIRRPLRSELVSVDNFCLPQPRLEAFSVAATWSWAWTASTEMESGVRLTDALFLPLPATLRRCVLVIDDLRKV